MSWRRAVLIAASVTAAIALVPGVAGAAFWSTSFHNAHVHDATQRWQDNNNHYTYSYDTQIELEWCVTSGGLDADDRTVRLELRRNLRWRPDHSHGNRFYECSPSDYHLWSLDDNGQFFARLVEIMGSTAKENSSNHAHLGYSKVDVAY